MGRTDLADGDAPFMETGQRVVDLEFEVHDFCHLHVNVLTEQNIAPPGWYMLFLVNKQAVLPLPGGYN